MKKGKQTSRPAFIRVDRKDLYFGLACLALILLKHMLAIQLPISPRPGYRTDDNLMVMMARNILRGNWLGTYSYGTLMKGCFFPLFLSAAYTAGIPYLSALDLLNSAAALYFTLSLKPLLRKRKWMLILFAVLVFNPVNAAELTFERVYRCSITNFQTLFLFGSVFAAYLDREDRFGRQLARALFCGFMLWSAWNTREDAIWMLPIVLVAGVVMLALRLKARRTPKAAALAAVLFLAPFLVLLGGNTAVSLANQHYYGMRIVNEADAGFGQMIKTMYSIRNAEHIEHVSVSAEKLERMYQVSPTLRQIRPELTESLQQADNASDASIGDGEVEDGWFYWCVRRALESSGIAKTLPEADAFYRKVDAELQEAIRNPENHFEKQWIMPSALMSPWQEGYEATLPEYIVRAAEYMVTYAEVSAAPRVVQPNVERISFLFEGITGNASVHSGESFVGEYRKIYISRADAVTSVYQAVNPYIAILSLFLFAVQAIAALVRRRKEEIPWLLVEAGTGLSALLLLIGIAYTDMTAFIAIRYTYISGGYALMLAFEWTVLLRFADRIPSILKRGGARSGHRGNRADDPDALPQ